MGAARLDAVDGRDARSPLLSTMPVGRVGAPGVEGAQVENARVNAAGGTSWLT